MSTSEEVYAASALDPVETRRLVEQDTADTAVFDESIAARARAIIARYPQARSALLPMLHLVQSVEGYVSQAGITFCADQLDLANAEGLGAAAENAVSNRARGLVLDLSGVTFLDSTGLRLVFRLARRLHDRQQSLRLVVPDGARIARVLTVSGVSTVAEVVHEHRPEPSSRTTGAPP